jgi:hypothetical protein
MHTGRPVRWLGREEMQFGSPRGAERIYQDGVMRDGPRIVTRKIRAYFDSAYTRHHAVVNAAARLYDPQCLW